MTATAALGGVSGGAGDAGNEVVSIATRWIIVDLYRAAVSPSGKANGGVALTYLSIDIDIDSDNNNHDGFPQRSEWEETLEEEEYGLGRLIMLDKPDRPLTPVLIQLPPGLPPPLGLPPDDDLFRVRLDWNQAGDAGTIKLWTSPLMDEVRRPESVANGGHQVFPGESYTLEEIGYGGGQILLYAEGIAENAALKTLAGVEREGKPEEYIRGTFIVKGQEVGSDKVKYLVANEDSFFYQLQTRQEVRNALASRGVYTFADLKNFCLRADANLADKAVPGLRAMKYQDYITGKDQYVLALGGTDDKWDWGNNFAQGWGLLPDQYNEAIDLGIKFKKDVSMKGHLVVTGHSLGGGLASAAALAGGFPADTFNAAWLHENTRSLIGPDANGGAIRAYYVDYDILTFLQARVGDWRDDGIIRIAPVGSLQPLDSPYDVDIAVASAAIATLFVGGSFAGPAAAAGAGRVVDIMVTCHNLNVVLYGLLVREGNPAVDMLGYSRSEL
jgi:hypothetical protein